MLNLSIILEDSARRFPTKPAFIFMDKAVSYFELNELSNKVANGLRSIGIEPGDKVALTCPNMHFFPIIYYGILKYGAVVVPLNILLKKEEIEFHLKDSDAKAYFCSAGSTLLPTGEIGLAAFEAVEKCTHFFILNSPEEEVFFEDGIATFHQFILAQSPVFSTYQTEGNDTCIIMYTSGTTGRAKGAELTHANLLMNAIVVADMYAAIPDDVLLTVLPLFHIFGMTVLMNAGVYRGCSNILIARFNAETVFSNLQKYKVTIFAGVPTMYWSLLNYTGPQFDYSLIASTLKVCLSGGASLPLKVLEDFEKRFNVPVIEGYGMSEGSPVVTFNQLKLGRKPGSIGLPVWGVQVKLVNSKGGDVAIGEKGELIFKGHNVMKGYYKNETATAMAIQNGWMHSGDVAIKDNEGFYFIVDRLKDMIIRGGLKVYPREIEELIIKHEAVSLVAVIGIPHEELGEEVKAFVVLKDNFSLSESDLIDWVKVQIAAYKYPRYIEFLTSLPLSGTGKILKTALRK